MGSAFMEMPQIHLDTAPSSLLELALLGQGDGLHISRGASKLCDSVT